MSSVRQWFLRRSRSVRDRIILLVAAVVVFAASASVHAADAMIAWLYQHSTWRLNELLTVSLFLVFAAVVYIWRRRQEYLEEVVRRRKLEAEREELIAQLQRIVDDFPLGTTLLPICLSCKRVRDRRGSWRSIEVYLASRFHLRLDHGICPDCAKIELAHHASSHHQPPPDSRPTSPEQE